jgi:hypothetical protein
LHYSTQPPGRCSRGIYDWSGRKIKLAPLQQEQLSVWAKWKYSDCLKKVANSSGWIDEAAWSLFRESYDSGIDNFRSSVLAFYLRKDLANPQSNVDCMNELTASFLLGNILVRDHGPIEDRILFYTLHTSYLASVKQDLALAIMLQLKSYRIPHQWDKMKPSELLDDGLEQYERNIGGRVKTKLPKGLFELGSGSVRCKPALYLDDAKVQDLGDVYSAIEDETYRPITSAGHVMIRFRDRRRPATSRMARAMTYATAFDGKSTHDAQEFMRKVGVHSFWNFGRRNQGALSTWAGATIRGVIPTPRDSWSSSAHERAIFQKMLHARSREWGDFPEIDHEAACFDMMCDFAGIRPDSAREKKLGLIVKMDDPPCIGLLNGQAYKDLKLVEDYQLKHGPPSPEARTRDNWIFPEDWISVLVTNSRVEPGKKGLVLEALNTHTEFDPASIKKAPRPEPLPTYCVLAVWFWSGKGDSFIGAELVNSWTEECDAVLL